MSFSRNKYRAKTRAIKQNMNQIKKDTPVPARWYSIDQKIGFGNSDGAGSESIVKRRNINSLFTNNSNYIYEENSQINLHLGIIQTGKLRVNIRSGKILHQ